MEHFPQGNVPPSKCKTSVYVLTEICRPWSKWLDTWIVGKLEHFSEFVDVTIAKVIVRWVSWSDNTKANYEKDRKKFVRDYLDKDKEISNLKAQQQQDLKNQKAKYENIIHEKSAIIRNLEENLIEKEQTITNMMKEKTNLETDQNAQEPNRRFAAKSELKNHAVNCPKPIKDFNCP